MSLYSYKKTKPHIREPEEVVEEEKKKPEPPAPRPHLPGVKKVARILIPGVLIFAGTVILLGQLFPYARHLALATFADKFDQKIVMLVPDAYAQERAKYIGDPGADYFSDVVASLEETTKPDEFSEKYEGKFYLTIPSIGLENAPVTANVNSYDENVYRATLGFSLAHFKGTKIPGRPGNAFIYGHSAGGYWAERNPDDIVTVFTDLFDMNIGDEVFVEIDGREIKYVVMKIKETAPDDISVLQDTPGQNTLTLMTCSPPGLHARRLVVVAKEV